MASYQHTTKPHGLHPFDAVTLAVDSFERPTDQWTAGQRKALEDYQRIAFRYIEALDCNDDSIFYTIDNGLEPLIKLFGRIFFCGKLEDIEFRPRRTLDAYGLTRESESSDKWLIEVDVNHHTCSADSRRSQSVIATVLHECGHAMLETTVCRGRNGSRECRDNKCAKAYDDLIGRKGHGAAWHLLVKAVERKANEVLGAPTQLNLGRERALREALKDTGLPADILAFCSS